jgi:hypothetical protein
VVFSPEAGEGREIGRDLQHRCCKNAAAFSAAFPDFAGKFPEMTAG